MPSLDRSAAEALAWLRAGRPVARALLVDVEGSAPLAPGAMLFVDGDARVEGSITGGCVEAAVAQEGAELLRSGGPPKVLTYGISDDLAGTVGLTCGGTVHVFVEALAADGVAPLVRFLEAAARGVPAALATVLDGPRAGAKVAVTPDDAVGALGGPALLEDNVVHDARALLAAGRGAVRRYGDDGARMGAELRVHVGVRAEPPRMLLVGAGDFAAALAALARGIGYAVTISDPRTAFLSSPRFSASAQTVAAWPDEAIRRVSPGPRDAVVILSHDPKIDVPAALAAFATDAGYIGALGSRRTAADRSRRLREAGAGAADLARLHAPCGLDIGAASPEQTAIAILAEVIATRAGRDARPLRATSGAIRDERALG